MRAIPIGSNTSLWTAMKLSRVLLAALALLLTPFAGVAQSASSAVDEGVKLFEAKKYAEAKATLAPAAGSNHVAAYYLGRIAADQNDMDKAVDWLEKAVKMNGASSEYHLWLGRAYCEKAQNASKLK